MLRKASYPDYFRKDNVEAQMMRSHLGKWCDDLEVRQFSLSRFRPLPSAYIPNIYRTTDHCAETLREVLMCNSGVGLIMFHWANGLDEPYPDYNTFHQCRDNDAVLN